MEVEIRHIAESDYPAVVKVTREAFWNLYVPGCDEHFLAHVMHTHPDYIAQLAYAAVYENSIVGSIQYTHSHIACGDGRRIDTCTFGPISVEPQYQRQGIGGALINRSAEAALASGFGAIVILGNPFNYYKHGFRNSKDFAISDREGKYPFGLLVRELKQGFLSNAAGRFHHSNVYESVDGRVLGEFDAQFAPKEKKWCYSQDLFLLTCRAFVG
jgi:predicted N-acetyltransferase YhbS